LEKAVQEARVGNMTLYFGVLAKAAIRIGLAKTQEIGTTADELENFHETAENTAEIGGMISLVEEVHQSDVHNLHPLLKLKKYIEEHEAESLIHKGQTGEEIFEKLVSQKLENMFEHVRAGNDPGLIQMIVDDMRQFGLEPMMKKSVGESLSEAINALADGTKTVDEVRPFFATLRLVNLGEILEAVRIDVVDEFLTQSFDNPTPDLGERMKKLTDDLEILGLYK
jgi:RNase H-fold protein (predicted Holliday junction resolvase)